MLTLSPDTHLTLDRGPFRVRRIRPGLILGPEALDTGFGGLGQIDHARLSPGLVVGMHEHQNDEIVSYLRAGEMVHTDSGGRRETVRANRLMVMNAGSGFSHEERVPAAPVRMLQIFIRPAASGLEPGVQFHDLAEPASVGRWRLLAGPEGSGAPTWVRQAIHFYDAALPAGQSLAVPGRADHVPWLYVVAGRVEVGGTPLSEGWAAAAVGEPLGPVVAAADAELALFLVDRAAPASRAGSLSG